MGHVKPSELAPLMVAPNGAHRTKADHPAIPITIAETIVTAKACFDMGAGALHFHVRDEKQQHVLDAGLYHEALTELKGVVPEMHLQITTEAIGRYNPTEMRDLAYAVMPPGISIGTIEMIPNREPQSEDIKLYQTLHEAGTAIQHICYDPEDIDLLTRLLSVAGLPKDDLWCLFVIGHYTGRVSHPDLIVPFLEKISVNGLTADWAICAFAEEENESLRAAIAHGGKIRVGFENSLLMPDGSIAKDNADRVAAAKALFFD
jgi:uncharacterized protein (DUF849 family)